MSPQEEANFKRLRVSEKKLRLVIQEKFSGKKCWNAGKYLGSMLYFDFGFQVPCLTIKNKKIVKGEIILSIRDCYWEIYEQQSLLVNSNTVDDNFSEKFNGKFDKQELKDFFIKKSSYDAVFMFSSQISLVVDLTNEYKETNANAIVVVTLEDKQVYEISPKGYIYTLSKV
jgi:hypothetical protein